MKSQLKNLEVVLVRAENPVNIGQTARAMKNFGITKLHLVSCAPHKVERAFTPACKGSGILRNAKCYTKLSSVLSKASFSAAFTARTGKYRTAAAFPGQIPEFLKRLEKGKLYLVFGNEKSGLSNEELAECHCVVTLPAHQDYTSLNLSHAAALSLGMIYSAYKKPEEPAEKPSDFYPKPGELETFLKIFEKTLTRIGYAKKGNGPLRPGIHEDFKTFFRRAELDRKELHLFQSFIARASQRLK